MKPETNKPETPKADSDSQKKKIPTGKIVKVITGLSDRLTEIRQPRDK